jgi:hypothetical protein
MNKILFFFTALMAGMLLHTGLMAQSDEYYLHSSNNQIWKVAPQSAIGNDPDKIMAPGYDPKDWVTAIVPGTIFSSYVAAGLEKDPNFGDNIYKVDRAKYDRNFWYRTSFKVPGSYHKSTVWLNFKGVNRKADIYLNGKKLGTLDGFMQRGQYNITGFADREKENILTVLVYLPQQPLANVGSPNYVSSASWDWMPYVPGLNSGITDKVYLSNTGDVAIEDPWIRTVLPTNAKAEISISFGVKNTGTGSRSAVVSGVIWPGNITFAKKITVSADGQTAVKLDKNDLEQLVINSPKLWWPNGYGAPNLYNCKLSLTVGDQVSDVKNIKFGIKRYTYDSVGNVMHVYINGVKIFIKGGDWGMSEYLLRCAGQEYDTKLRYHKEMNFNMIRNWIGSTTDEEFYDACDKYGLMVWDEFWLNGNDNLPADINVFNANAIEKIKRFRNHPSIAVWCAENEGWPMAPLRDWLKDDLAAFDGGERIYKPNSHAESLTGSGPWASHDPRYYFTAYPVGSGGTIGWGLRTELGTAVFTNFESFKKFMPKDKWWPRNEMWNQHFFGPLAFNAGPDSYDESITTGYGAPKGIEDYCRKAQLLNIETNKAMFEGWEDHMGEDASGLMTWMSQSAYPSLVWQTYDYYYDLTGAYWGAKKACEPLHIQWNPVTDAIKIINTTRQDAEGLKATAEVYNLDGQLVNTYNESALTNAPANSVTEVFKMKFNPCGVNLALNKSAYASSTTSGEPGMVTDGNNGSRWASKSNDDEWITVDLGKDEVVNGVGLNWEEAYAKAYKIQASRDAKSWHEVYYTANGRPGEQKISFPEATARYIRMKGIERGTYWGYSLYNFEVYQGNIVSEGLSDVHFIKLKLTDKSGKLVSDNFYWRGNKRKDYTALNTLPKINLKLNYKTLLKDGRYFITANITNPASSNSVAFSIRVQAEKTSNSEQLLPAFVNENYFSLMPGEAKAVTIEFQASVLGSNKIKIVADPYNNFK